MGGTKLIFALAACVALGASQPVQQLAVLKEQPEEVLYRVGDGSRPFLLECVTEGASHAKYSWTKDGKPFDFHSKSNIAQRKEEGSLVFLKPADDDAGIYQCHAETETGVASTRPITVKKTFINAPKVEAKKHKPIDGKTYQLECPIPESYPKPKIQWYSVLDKDPTISSIVADQRYTISPEGTLYFSSVQKEDVGTRFKYSCQATTPASDEPVILAEHFLEELTPDKGPKVSEVVQQYVSKDMTVKAGDTEFIYCIFGGVPLAHPDWFKDGKDVNNGPGDRVTRHNRSVGKRLLIRDIIPEDQGEYKCVVDNELGSKKEHTMHLTVVSPPKFAKKPEKQITVKAGQDAVIPCQVTGIPPATTAWTYNAKALSNNRAAAGPAELKIKGVQKSDTGYYGCQATNEHGNIYAETLLFVV